MESIGGLWIIGKGESEMPGKMAKYQDIYEIKSSEHRVLTARTLGEYGQWTQFMTANLPPSQVTESA